jgi:trimethylamine--corrinoid protein Co-methyltransferase
MFLPEEKAKKIHEATIQVLEKTGVYLDHQEAEALYLGAGATKDDEGRILIKRNMVEEALEKAHPEIQLYDRNGDKSIQLKIGTTYFGPGSDALYNIDKQTGELRLSTKSDVSENVKIVDALSGFNFVMSMALPEDDPDRLYAAVFAEMIGNTTKPIVTTATSLADIKHIHAIASIVAGDKEQLKEKPFFLAYLEPISPLKMDESSTDRLLYCAQNEIPIIYAAGANCGSGAPITPEGGVIQGGAESLAGLVLALLKNENARFVYGANTSSMDMKTTLVCYGAPEWFKTVAMYADMGEYYNLPSWGTAGSSDSFYIDAQAAMEAYEGVLLALQSGSSLVHDVGYLAHGELYDARMLVLTDEMIRRAKHVLKEVDLSKNALAVEVINDVARGNDLYLAHTHTFENFKKALWLPPPYINRKAISERGHDGELNELLTYEVSEILSGHKPQELNDSKKNQIYQYVESI